MSKNKKEGVAVCVILTPPSIVLLPQLDVKVSRALGAERQQQALQYRRGAGESEQHGPHAIIAERKVQTYDLHTPTHTPTVLVVWL